MKHAITNVRDLRVGNIVYKYPHSTEYTVISGVELPNKITIIEKGTSSKKNMLIYLKLNIETVDTPLCYGIPITDKIFDKLLPEVKHLRTTPRGVMMYGNAKFGLYFGVIRNSDDILQITGIQFQTISFDLIRDTHTSLHQLQNLVYDITNGKIEITLK